MSDRFRLRNGRKPPPLHHFREVLSYNPKADSLEPRYWDIPFGFEQALSERKQILLIPQINGADGGIAINSGLKNLVDSALMLIYTQGTTLYYETVTVSNLILVCYSQSCGNLFTACNKNLSDIKGSICFEPQYMNQYLRGEDKSLALGKDVIPKLIKQGGKVIIIGRHKYGWEGKYLPSKTNPDDLIILPDDAHYFILDYPDPAKPYNPDASPVLALRYSRLLKDTDPVIDEMLSKETGVIDFASATNEANVEEIIMKYRKAGFSDEMMIKHVFTGAYNVDSSGGYYTHNFIISYGQELAGDNGNSVMKFFHQALSLIN